MTYLGVSLGVFLVFMLGLCCRKYVRKWQYSSKRRKNSERLWKIEKKGEKLDKLSIAELNCRITELKEEAIEKYSDKFSDIKSLYISIMLSVPFAIIGFASKNDDFANSIKVVLTIGGTLWLVGCFFDGIKEGGKKFRVNHRNEINRTICKIEREIAMRETEKKKSFEISFEGKGGVLKVHKKLSGDNSLQINSYTWNRIEQK